MQIELEELTDLVTELVDLATDARAEEPQEQVELGALAERVVGRARRRTGREISFAVDDPRDRRRTRRARSNGRWPTSSTTRASSVRRRRRSSCASTDATIEVLDRGPGIADDDRAHVFDRFYRAPAARTMPGSGLGLSIVKQIATLQGGSVELLPRAGGGTVARLVLPAVTSRS